MTLYEKTKHSIDRAIELCFDMVDKNQAFNIVDINAIIIGGIETQREAYQKLAGQLRLVDDDITTIDDEIWDSNRVDKVKDIQDYSDIDSDFINRIQDILMEAYNVYFDNDYAYYGTAQELVENYAPIYWAGAEDFIADFIELIDCEMIADNYILSMNPYIDKYNGEYYELY